MVLTIFACLSVLRWLEIDLTVQFLRVNQVLTQSDQYRMWQIDFLAEHFHKNLNQQACVIFLTLAWHLSLIDPLLHFYLNSFLHVLGSWHQTVFSQWHFPLQWDKLSSLRPFSDGALWAVFVHFPLTLSIFMDKVFGSFFCYFCSFLFTCLCSDGAFRSHKGSLAPSNTARVSIYLTVTM